MVFGGTLRNAGDGTRVGHIQGQSSRSAVSVPSTQVTELLSGGSCTLTWYPNLGRWRRGTQDPEMDGGDLGETGLDVWGGCLLLPPPACEPLSPSWTLWGLGVPVGWGGVFQQQGISFCLSYCLQAIPQPSGFLIPLTYGCFSGHGGHVKHRFRVQPRVPQVRVCRTQHPEWRQPMHQAWNPGPHTRNLGTTHSLGTPKWPFSPLQFHCDACPILGVP